MPDILVTDTGFTSFDGKASLLLSATDAPETFAATLGDYAEIHIEFSSSADGRGFSLARRLRELGFGQRLYATGQLVCDQYRHARQAGFDGVIITKDQARKMPEPHWIEQAERITVSYQDRLLD